MTTLLSAALALAGLSLFSLRPLADCPAARTPRQLHAAARHADRRRTILIALGVTIVVGLLLVVGALKVTWYGIAAAGFVLATLAGGLDLLLTAQPTPLTGGAP